jgi:hypothetical protein
MAWALVQSQSASAITATVTATLGATPTTGNKLIALVSYNGAAIKDFISVKDGNSVAFTQLVDVHFADAGDIRIGLYAMDVPATPNAVITLTVNSAADCSILVQEVSGLLAGNTSAMLDGTAGTSHAGTNTYTAPTYSSTAAGEYLVAGYVDNGGPLTWAVANSYIADAHGINTNSNDDNVIAAKNSTNGAEASPFTLSGTAAGWASLLVAFKVAAGGAAPSSPQGPYPFPPFAAPFIIPTATPFQQLGDRTVVAGSAASLAPAAGILTFDGTAPALTVGVGQNLATPAGVLTLSGTAPAWSSGTIVATTAGVITLSGTAPALTVGVGQNLTPAAGIVTLSGTAPALTVGVGQNLTTPAGIITFDGTPAVVTAGSTADPNQATPGIAWMFLQPNAAAFQLAGDRSTTATIPASINPPAGVLALGGTAPAVAAAASLSPAAGILTLSGTAPAVTTGGGQNLFPAAGVVTLSGTAPTLTVGVGQNLAALPVSSPCPGRHPPLRPEPASTHPQVSSRSRARRQLSPPVADRTCSPPQPSSRSRAPHRPSQSGPGRTWRPRLASSPSPAAPRSSRRRSSSHRPPASSPSVVRHPSSSQDYRAPLSRIPG